MQDLPQEEGHGRERWPLGVAIGLRGHPVQWPIREATETMAERSTAGQLEARSIYYLLYIYALFVYYLSIYWFC